MRLAGAESPHTDDELAAGIRDDLPVVGYCIRLPVASGA
jgi:hypothetical protein